MIHADEARKRVATQYTESTRFLLALEKLTNQCQNLEEAFQQVQLITDIDLSQGVNLDVLGDIVGVSRYIPRSVSVPFFGFYDTGTATQPFGEELMIAIGGRFREELESPVATTVLQDPEYRTLIRSKIFKNHSIGTPEDVIRGLNYIFNSGEVFIDDSGGMKVSVLLTRPLSLSEKVLVEELDILPRPNGVGMKIKGWIFTSCFGFSDTYNSVGFSEEGSSSLDHLFFEEII